MNKIKFRKCEHEWIPRMENPQECPSCKTRKWKEYKEIKKEKTQNGG